MSSPGSACACAVASARQHHQRFQKRKQPRSDIDP